MRKQNLLNLFDVCLIEILMARHIINKTPNLLLFYTLYMLRRYKPLCYKYKSTNKINRLNFCRNSLN